MKASRILIATDGSSSAERATRFAISLLRLHGADVRLLTVLSHELDPYSIDGVPLADASDRLRAVQSALDRATQGSRQALENAGVRVHVSHRVGHPADEILSEIDAWEPDLVVLGRRGLRAPQRWLLGSVSDRVSRHAKAPVLVVP